MWVSNIGKIVNSSKYKREYIQENLPVTANTLSNWCTGKSHPKGPQLFELSRLIEVDVNEFYSYREDTKNKKRPL